MIPLLSGISAAASVLGHVLRPSRAEHGKQTAGLNFQNQLANQLQKTTDQLTSKAQLTNKIQSMIALQQSTGSLPLDQQFTLAKMVLNKNVQVADSKGSPVIGKVSEVNFQNGQVQLAIQGKNFPISSLMAVMDGIPQH